MNKWKYFTEEEVVGLVEKLVDRLDRMRDVAGFPFKLTCTLRASNDNVGVEDSAHKTGQAVDIAIEGGHQRYQAVMAALAVGFRRIGVYDHHVHVDIDETKPQQVIWVGVSK